MHTELEEMIARAKKDAAGTPADRVCASAIEACAKLGMHKEGLGLFSELQANEAGAVPSQRAFFAALDVCAVAQDTVAARALLDEIQAVEEVSGDGDGSEVAQAWEPQQLCKAYGIALRSCSGGDVAACSQILASMQEGGWVLFVGCGPW